MGFRNTSTRKRSLGVTLIELMVSVAIWSIIISAVAVLSFYNARSLAALPIQLIRPTALGEVVPPELYGCRSGQKCRIQGNAVSTAGPSPYRRRWHRQLDIVGAAIVNMGLSDKTVKNYL